MKSNSEPNFPTPISSGRTRQADGCRFVPLKTVGKSGGEASFVNDRRAVEKHLADENIPITETVELADGTVFFFIRDPDDNVIEFHQPKPF